MTDEYLQACSHIGRLVVEKQILERVISDQRAANLELSSIIDRMTQDARVRDERIETLEHELWGTDKD
jgi:hypothetical protein